MPRSRKNSDQWQAKISSLTLIAFFVTFGATAKWRKKRLKYLIRLHPRFPLCYAEAAMKTKDCNRPQKPHRCRSPKLTPARLAACRANARKWVAQTAAVAVCGCSDAHRDFVAQTAV